MLIRFDTISINISVDMSYVASESEARDNVN